MSQKLSLLKFAAPSDARTTPITDMTVPLGSSARVRALVSVAFPTTDWSNPALGFWRGADGTVEFELDDADEIDAVTVHVDAGAETEAAIAELAAANGWKALDRATGEFLSPDDAEHAVDEDDAEATG